MHSKFRILIGLAVVLFFVMTYDIVTSLYDGMSLQHVLQELLIVSIALYMMYILYDWLKEEQFELETVRKQLNESRSALATQSKEMEEARSNYSKTISEQFIAWKLTKSETKTAYALLKGLSLKEIALLNNVQEKTIRQHASNLYRKAGLDGRHALSAWFFEDLIN